MVIDVTKYEVGVALGRGLVVVACPKCGKPSVETGTARKSRWAHSLTVQRGGKKRVANKAVAVVFCG